MKNFYSLFVIAALFATFTIQVQAQDDITGYLWVDNNGNGIQDGGEPALDGVTVNLLDMLGLPTGISDVSGSVNPGEYTLSGGTVGNTYFVAIDPGTLPPGYVATALMQGGNAMIDSDIDQALLRTAGLMLPAGGLTDIDGGFYATVSCGDLVWLDDNGNGIDDDGSLPLPVSVNVELFRETPLGSGTWVSALAYDGSTIPGGNPQNTSSTFLFDNLSPGNYRITFANGAPSIFFTYANINGGNNQGNDDTDDSDAIRATGISHTFQLFSGDPYYDQVDAGYFGPTEVNGIVWEDLDGNGFDDEGSPALPVGVDITLEYNDPVTGGWIPAADQFDGNPIPANPINTSTTYSFQDLPPGEYRVVFDEPGDANPALLHLTQDHVNDGGAWPVDDTDDSDADRLPGAANGRSHNFMTTSSAPGDVIDDVDAGYFLGAEIGDFVFEDMNGDGDQSGDPGLDIPVDINLYRVDLGGVPALDVDGNPYVLPVNQNGAGIYNFFPLPPGEYQVEFVPDEPTIFITYVDAVGETLDSDADETTGYTTATYVMMSGDVNTDVDAGFFKPAIISDFVWEDMNADGIQDGGEPGLDGVQVEIFEAITLAPVNYADGTPTAGTVVTAGGGMYEFNPLRPGDYVVQFTPPSAPDQYYISPMDQAGGPGQGGDVGNDSDADPANFGYTFDITVMSDDVLEDIDCGMFRGASVGDYTWEDLDGNGIQDAGEPPLGGVTVDIRDFVTGLPPIDLTTGLPVPVQVTGGGGNYSFDNIPPGQYELTFTEPAPTFFLTRVNQTGGPDDAGDTPDDSDPDPLNGNRTHVVELESGEDNDDIDAGFVRPAELGDMVWHDGNADGIRDGTEIQPLPPGFTITIMDVWEGGIALDVSGNPAVANVNAAGLYLFSGATALKPGLYSAQIGMPGGWILSDPDQTGDDMDSDFDPGTLTTLTDFTLMSNEQNYDLDAGVYQNLTIGGIVWGEQDDDCLFGASEFGYGMVDLVLVGEDDGAYFTTSDDMGMYMFMDVKPGTYNITIPESMFADGAPLNNLLSCDPFVPAQNDDTPFDNNGTGPDNGPIETGFIEFICGEEPGQGGLENKTIDFGFQFDCASDVNNPFSNLDCETAADNPICNLNVLLTGCATMYEFSNPTGPATLCGNGAPHNTSWFSFIAGYGDYDIFIELFGCIPGMPGSPAGIQAGIAEYDPEQAPPCWQTGGIVFCNDGVNNPPGITLPGDDFIPGNQYVMWLDGFSFSICGYAFDIIGDYTPFFIPDPETLTCDGNDECDIICPNTDHVFVVNGSFDNVTYEDLSSLVFGWSLRDENMNIIDSYVSDPNNFETEDNEITISFPSPGTYFVCLERVTDQCNNEILIEFCKEVVVIEREDEDFGTVPICSQWIPVYSGPTTVNDDPNETDDPNGDGTPGWQNPGGFIPGLRCDMITDDYGCMYEQCVIIEEIFNSELAEVTTAVCGDFPFTLEMENSSGDTYNFQLTGEASGIFVQIPFFAENGCDSLNTFSIYNLELEGGIELVGCNPNGGFDIIFVPTLIDTLDDPNNPSYTNIITYEWTDDMGNVLPHGSNPFTLTVPAAGVYHFNAVFETQFLIPGTEEVSCPFVFDYTLNTDNFLPEAPIADNWDNQFCEYDNIFTYVADTTANSGGIIGYNWTYPSDATVVSGLGTDSLTLDWSGSMGGPVCVSVTNGCGTSLPVCDTVVIIPTPVAAIAPMDSICVDSLTTVVFSGSADTLFTYAWNFDGGSPDGSTDVPGPIPVTWSVPGVKNVSLTITKQGCVSSTAMENILVVEPVPAPVITCTASIDEVVFTWNDPPGQTNYIPTITTGQMGGILNGNTFTQPNLMVGETVNITLVTNTTSPCGDLVSTGTCKAQDCPAKVLDIESVAPICFDASTPEFLLSATINPSDNGTYNWVGPGITDAATGAFDPKLANTGNNVINLTYTDENGCDYFDQVTISVNPIPTSDFITDKIVVCQDSSVNVQYNGNIAMGGQFSWTAGDVTTPLNGRGPFNVRWMTPGDKLITLNVTRAGCPSEETQIPVTVEPRIQPIMIDCDEESTSIGITWSNLANVGDYTLYIDGNPILVNTTDTSYDLTGLTPLTTVTILVEANSSNSCPGVSLETTCQAVSCPPFDIQFNVNDTTLCLDASALPFQLEAYVTGGPGLGGAVGTWSGPGVDPMTGMFDPNAAGVSPPGGHIITYNHTESICMDSKTLTINLINQPTAEFAGPPVICVDDVWMVSYNGTAPNLPFDWTIDGGGTLNKTGPTNYTIKWDNPGTYNVDLQVGTGTCLSEVESATVQVDPQMVPVDVTCTSTLSSVTFEWNDIDCASSYEVIVGGTSQGIQSGLTFLVDNLNEGDMVDIQIIPQEDCACPAIPTSFSCTARACPPVVLELSTPNPEFCVGTITAPFNLGVNVLNSETPGTGSWSGTGVNAAGSFNPSGLTPGVYTLTYDYNEMGCDFSNSIDVIINENPTVAAEPTQPDCYQDNFGSAIVTPAGGTGPDYDVFLNGTQVQPTDLLNLAPANYNIQVIDEKGCRANTTFTIQTAIAAQLEINGNTLIKAGDDGTLMADVTSLNGTLDSIVWYRQSDNQKLCSGPDCETITISPDEDDTYCAVLYYNDGCTVEECADIRVRRVDVIILPNVIAPGGSGSNEKFFVPEYETIMQVRSMVIFDRWGEVVFREALVPKGPAYGWNGTLNGKPVVGGVYVYVVELDMENGDVLQLSGDVTVMPRK